MTSGKEKYNCYPRSAWWMCLFSPEPLRNVSFAQETAVARSRQIRSCKECGKERATRSGPESYRGTRIYNLEYHGLSSKSATLVVAMTYRRPDVKKFCIISESGSELLQGRVLKRLLEAEVEGHAGGTTPRQTAMVQKTTNSAL